MTDINSLFSLVFGILDTLGVLNILGYTIGAILIIGITFRVLDAIGNR